MEGFIGEIRMFAANFAPYGWMQCEGQHLSVTKYNMLFEVIKTTYGGDGVSTFALPDYRGRVPNGRQSNTVLGALSGEAKSKLEVEHMPAHSHTVRCSASSGTQNSPVEKVWAVGKVDSQTGKALDHIFSDQHTTAAMAQEAIQKTGGNDQNETVAHENTQPSLGMHYIIYVGGHFD